MNGFEYLLSGLWLLAIGLAGTKINEDFGPRGGRAILMLLLVIFVITAAIGVAYGDVSLPPPPPPPPCGAPCWAV